MRAIILAVTATTLLCGAANAFASPITISESLLFARAENGSLPLGDGVGGDINLSTAFGTASVFVDQSGNQVNGGRSWTESGNAATLEWGASLQTTGVQYDSASFSNTLFFTANVNAIYSLSGLFTSQGINGTLGLEGFNARLLDITDCLPLTSDVNDCVTQTPSNVGFLFGDYTSTTIGTVDQTFPLGVAGDGDDPGVSATFGSLTGNLVAGRVYEFNLGMAIYGEDGGDGTLASGNVRLDIAAASVPEPAPMGLLAIGLMLARLRRGSGTK